MLFPCALFWRQFISSTFFSAEPDATFIFAAHLSFWSTVLGSKCVLPKTPWQSWRLFVFLSPSQRLQGSARTFPILPLGSHCQAVSRSVSHPDFWSPINFLRCAPSASGIARVRSQQKLGDKIDWHLWFSLAGINYVFLCYMKIEINLRTCREVGKFRTKTCSK